MAVTKRMTGMDRQNIGKGSEDTAAMRQRRRSALKAASLSVLLTTGLFALSGCVSPDPVDGHGQNANPTLLQFATATPVPAGFSGEEETFEQPISGWMPQAAAPQEQTPSPNVTFAIVGQETTEIGDRTEGGNLHFGMIGLQPSEETTPVPEATVTPLPALREGDKGDRVRSLQQQLKNLGYYDGSVDGHFGEGTKDALKAFQSRNGLSADGIAGSATLKLLSSGNAKKAAPSPTPAPTSSALRVGSEGTKVRNMQQRLKDLGYYSGSVDGKFGYGTETALKTFQRANGLSADGVAGDATLKKLNSSSAKSNYVASASATARATPRTYVASTLSSYRYLQQGSSGSDVKKMQQRLRDLGYFNGSCNGNFGADTEMALRAFQERNGLWVDGVAGEDSQRLLYSSEALSARR